MMLVVGMVAAAFLTFWLIDCCADAYIFREGGFLQLLFPRGPELWKRTIFLAIVLTLVILLVSLFNKKQQATKDLGEALHRNQLILNAAGEGIVGLDPAGCIVFVNAAVTRITGYEAGELIGRQLHEVLHYSKRNGTTVSPDQCPVHQTLKDGQLRRVSEDWFWTKEGKSFPVEYVATPVGNGSITGAVVVFRDISLRQAAVAELQKTRDFLENLLESSPDPIGIVDEHGRFSRWNEAAHEIFGYAPEEILGTSAFDIYADKGELEAMMAQLRRDGFVRRYEIRMRKKDRDIRPFALSIRLLKEQGRTVGSICVARDRSEIREAMNRLKAANALQLEIQDREAFQKALEEANEKLQSLVGEFEQRNRSISLLNELGDLLQACQSREEAYGAVAHYGSQIFPDTAGALFVLNPSRNLLQEASSWGQPSLGESVFAPDDCWAFRRGEVHRVQDSQSGLSCRHLASSASLADHLCIPMVAQGEILGLLYFQSRLCLLFPASDLAGEHHAGAKERLALALARQLSLALASLNLRESLRHQAIRDPLTGLFNRRYMEESLEREFLRVQRRHAPMGLIMLDLDHFKIFNDTYGHKAGDAMLAAMGNLVLKQVRREDIACRYGGEEFLLILPEAPLEATLSRAELLKEAMGQLQIDHQGQILGPLTTSFGVATFPEHAQNWEDLIRAADRALYQAKQRGRNRVEAARSTAEGELKDYNSMVERPAEAKS